MPSIEKILYASLIFIGLQLLIQGSGGRGVLVAAVWSAIVVVLSLRLPRQAVSGFIFGFIGVSLALTFLAVFQVGLEAIGYRAGLPYAYIGNIFGFARATLFFEEPQFLASYLLIGLYASTSLPAKYRYYAFGALTFGLVLTLSRGAALGAVVSFGVLWILRWKQPKEVLYFGATSLLGLLIGVLFLSAAGWVRSDQELTPLYFSEVYARQMLGVDIERSDKIGLVNVEYSDLESYSSALEEPNQIEQPSSTVSSADSRFVASEQALRDATDTPQSFIFGRGPGSYNKFMENRFGTQQGNGYTVNNLYVELLFEFGVVALIALIILIISVCVKLYRIGSELTEAIMLAIIAISVQQLFFSSLVNNLHFWVLLAVALSVCALAKTTNPAKAARKPSPKR